jgi:hypothetical protein
MFFGGGDVYVDVNVDEIERLSELEYDSSCSKAERSEGLCESAAFPTSEPWDFISCKDLCRGG